MRKKILRGSAIAAAALVLLSMVAALVMWAWPPDLVRVADGFVAETVCSNVFIAGRDPRLVLATDVQAPGNPILDWIRVDVDRTQGVVRARLLGFIGGRLAVARPGAGCAVMGDGQTQGSVGPAAAVAPRSIASPDAAPAADEGYRRPEAQHAIEDDTLSGPGMRGIVVIHDGHIVAERYANGFTADMPQLGWSMTKTVTAALIGLLIGDGRLTLEQSAGWPAVDARAAIRIEDLLAMSSGLEFNEAYGSVSDVTRMLYLEPDMAAFARGKPLAQPVGSAWNYSSGTAVIIARLFQDAAADAAGARAAAGRNAAAAEYIRHRLFDPLGMTHALIATDAHGTLVGGSYMFATPRDWAHFAQLLVQDGLWQGHELLPRGYVAWMASPVAASHGEYGHGMVWRWAMDSTKPGANPDTAFGIPADTFWMIGFDGQYAAIIPSRQLVVVRMGLTPDAVGYHPERLVRAVLDAVQ